ncbi:MAG: DUF5009 domain-containing protein [Bacteroidaceae bacterium]
MKSKVSSRILALDILRGITIAGMLLVNNPGSWGHIYAPFEHSSWNGLTPTDLIFPFFMFIMGISTYISLRKTAFVFTSAVGLKILRRTLLIWLIGLSVAWFSLFMRSLFGTDLAALPLLERLGSAANNFDHLRILGVMPRLAISYGVASLVALLVKHRYIPYLVAAILVGYFIILMVGNGFATDQTSILWVVDNAILGPNHMYGAGRIIEPEGIMSTLPAIAHVLLGFCCGRLMMEVKELHEKVEQLFIMGAVLTFVGFLLSYGCPINKKIWSPTFVITTCGLASTLLALLVWVIDIKGHRVWCRFFESFGVNPLFLYVLGGVISIIIGSVPMPFVAKTISIKGFIYADLLQPAFGDLFGSLIFAFLFLSMCWSIGYVLYTKKIYIKI